jgi:hypothetical protein
MFRCGSFVHGKLSKRKGVWNIVLFIQISKCVVYFFWFSQDEVDDDGNWLCVV